MKWPAPWVCLGGGLVCLQRLAGAGDGGADGLGGGAAGVVAGGEGAFDGEDLRNVGVNQRREAAQGVQREVG